jgi:hypothetical protein
MHIRTFHLPLEGPGYRTHVIHLYDLHGLKETFHDMCRPHFRPYRQAEFRRGTQPVCTVQCFPAKMDGYGNTISSHETARFIRKILPSGRPKIEITHMVSEPEVYFLYAIGLS